MDRREAIRKLAVGGAVATGGSIVLSSNNVAFASSIGDISGLPEPNDTIPVTYTPITSFPARVQVQVDPSDPSFPTVTCGGAPATTLYSWRLVSYDTASSFPEYTQVLVRNVSDSATVVAGPTSSISPSSGRAACPTIGCPTAFSSASTSNNGFTLRKRAIGTLFEDTPFEFPFTLDTSLQNGDSWAVDLQMRWQCQTSAVAAIYRYSGTFPAAPSVGVVQPPAPA